jgi:membrane protein DedA with SNARE-associated domain
MGYQYILVFISAALEGPLVALFVGFLVSLGHLQFVPAYFVLLFGDIIPDTIYYFIGRTGRKWGVAERYGKYLKVSDGHLRILEDLWRNHSMKTMVLGKLAYGLSTPILISAGLTKMPLKKFLTAAIPVTIAQYAVFLTAGYYFGNYYIKLRQYFTYAEFLIVGVVIIFLVIFFQLKKIATKRAEKMLDASL